MRMELETVYARVVNIAIAAGDPRVDRRREIRPNAKRTGASVGLMTAFVFFFICAALSAFSCSLISASRTQSGPKLTPPPLVLLGVGFFVRARRGF
jgi:hypothetical protein